MIVALFGSVVCVYTLKHCVGDHRAVEPPDSSKALHPSPSLTSVFLGHENAVGVQYVLKRAGLVPGR